MLFGKPVLLPLLQELEEQCCQERLTAKNAAEAVGVSESLQVAAVRAQLLAMQEQLLAVQEDAAAVRAAGINAKHEAAKKVVEAEDAAVKLAKQSEHLQHQLKYVTEQLLAQGDAHQKASGVGCCCCLC
jgi:pantothenate kinase